jgi:hypothetical protein
MRIGTREERISGAGLLSGETDARTEFEREILESPVIISERKVAATLIRESGKIDS